MDNKTAYAKGFASRAKTAEGAAALFAKNFSWATEEHIAAFTRGYEDFQAGRSKWSDLEAPVEYLRIEDEIGVVASLRVVPDAELAEAAAEGPVAVEVDGVTVAEVRHLELAPEPAAAPAGEEPTVAGNYQTILELRESITKDTSKQDREFFRRQVVGKKRHYTRGFEAFGSDKFANMAEAFASYTKRHGDATLNPNVNDWIVGYGEAAQGLAKGASWTREK